MEKKMSPKKEIIEKLWFEFIKAYFNDQQSNESRLPMIDETNRNHFMESLKQRIKMEKKGYSWVRTILVRDGQIEQEIYSRRNILGI
jgi:hypothetical protein